MLVRDDYRNGYIALVDKHGIRLVAEGFNGTNEIRFDDDEEWLYVVESTGRRISRLRARPDGSLTDRELVVLRLLATGLSDKAIAERLVISPRTVNAHLRSIYAKLDLTTRSAATRYAVDHQLS